MRMDDDSEYIYSSQEPGVVAMQALDLVVILEQYKKYLKLL